MPELSRRLKRQRWVDDHAYVIGRAIMFTAFAVFFIAVIAMAIFDTPIGWCVWLLIPVLIGAVITGLSDEKRPSEIPPHS